MEISVGAYNPDEALAPVNVTFWDEYDGTNFDVQCHLRVPNVDSRIELYNSAKAAALPRLKKIVEELEKHLQESP
ncbi:MULTISPECIES: hypothetical protein [unclassified Halomonas]|uniref:hypothetical protein n=1 Tax=unclassified Halomonas TaxID=2609666 RepID=UPI0040333624